LSQYQRFLFIHFSYVRVCNVQRYLRRAYDTLIKSHTTIYLNEDNSIFLVNKEKKKDTIFKKKEKTKTTTLIRIKHPLIDKELNQLYWSNKSLCCT